jgi:hypothetical protein
MDIYCPVCGEPWENDTLHDYAQETNSTYKNVYRSFINDGCGVAFTTWGVTCEPNPSMRTHLMGVLAEIMGDDVDGIMSSMEDAEYLGILD